MKTILMIRTKLLLLFGVVPIVINVVNNNINNNIILPQVSAMDNGVSLTPPMGWNSWNQFHCNDINEHLIKEIGHAMIDLGLFHVGYTFVNLDDCWQAKERDPVTNQIQADPKKFPSGIPYLRNYLHALQLQFGLYSDAGEFTCQHRPGSLGYEVLDATTYKEWKIDYLKYDNCYNTGMDVKERYQRMHDALNETGGHPIVFSMCEWGIQDPATWAGPIANSWRTTFDIRPTWKSITQIMDINNKWHDFAGPGGWNDPDMLEVGNGDLTIAEQKSHFTMWCLMKAPLLLGNDLRKLTKTNKNDSTILDIITNTELIAINQDPLGIQGYKRTTTIVSPFSSTTKTEENNNDNNNNNDDTNNNLVLEVWAGPLIGGQIAVVLLNRSEQAANITAYWQDIGMDRNETSMAVRDLWAHQDLGVYSESITALVESHDVAAYRLEPVSNGSIFQKLVSVQ